jgi:hypothetical protein
MLMMAARLGPPALVSSVPESRSTLPETDRAAPTAIPSAKSITKRPNVHVEMIEKLGRNGRSRAVATYTKIKAVARAAAHSGAGLGPTTTSP